jgi:hypothetical protein
MVIEIKQKYQKNQNPFVYTNTMVVVWEGVQQ